MKGAPLRIELGDRELKEKKLTIYRRDTNKKEKISEKNLIKEIEKISQDYDRNLINNADKLFKEKIKDVNSKKDLKTALEAGKIARCGFCSTDMDGEKCAEVVEKEALAKVRGKKLIKEKPSGKTSKCIICNKKAKEVVYIAKEY